MANIMSFGKVLKMFGFNIKSCEKVFTTKVDGTKYTDFLLRLKDGTTATYSVEKSADELVQTVGNGLKRVSFNTKKDAFHGWDIGHKGKLVNIPHTKTTGLVRDLKNGRIDYAVNYKRTPIDVRMKKDKITGNWKQQVKSVQELHTDLYVGSSKIPQDILLGSDGKRYPIYQRPMKMTSSYDPGIFRL